MIRPLVGDRVAVTATGAVGRVIDIAQLQREVLVEFGGLGQHWYREDRVHAVPSSPEREPFDPELDAHVEAIEDRIKARMASATSDLDRITGTGVVLRPGRVELVPKGQPS